MHINRKCLYYFLPWCHSHALQNLNQCDSLCVANFQKLAIFFRKKWLKRMVWRCGVPSWEIQMMILICLFADLHWRRWWKATNRTLISALLFDSKICVKIFPTFHQCLQCQPVKLVVVKAILKCLLLLLESDAERLRRRPRRDRPRLRETKQRSGGLTKSVKWRKKLSSRDTQKMEK